MTIHQFEREHNEPQQEISVQGLYLGIETSCDDTGVALYDTQRGVIAQQLASSSRMHADTAGIVPEVAARDHSRTLLPLTIACMREAQIASKDITAIGYTKGPGLVGSLMVGAAFAKSWAYAAGIPALGIHHLEGHLCSVVLDTNHPPPTPPYLALLVSGGHSHLFRVDSHFSYHLLGATRDDAAGEAFDKCAAMLGLGYPGGAALAALAKKGQANRFTFPRPMLGKPGLDLSFSGLKTAVRYCLLELGQEAKQPQTQADVAAGVEAAIVDSLLGRLKQAVATTGITQVVIAGGVSANIRLRQAVSLQPWQVWLPPLRLCTDNGAMIACATALRHKAGYADTDSAIDPVAVWPLGGHALKAQAKL